MAGDFKFKRFKPGDKSIKATDLNEPIEVLEAFANMQVGPAITFIQDDGGWYLDVDVPVVLMAQTPSGGIPAATFSSGTLAPGSADCTMFTLTSTGWSLASGVTETIYNTQVGSSVPGSTIVQCTQIDGRLIVNPGSYAGTLKAQTPSGGIASSGSASVSLGTWGGSSYSTTGATVTAWNPSATAAVSSSTWVTIAWVSGRWEVELDPC
jgi:hypothetical protein